MVHRKLIELADDKTDRILRKLYVEEAVASRSAKKRRAVEDAFDRCELDVSEMIAQTDRR